MVALAFAVQLWHFWLASILLAAIGVSIGVGSAFMTDLVPAEKIGWALTLFGFAGPVSGIAGFLSPVMLSARWAPLRPFSAARS